MSYSAPSPLKKLIEQLASRYRWQKRFSRRNIWKSWQEIAGKTMAEHAWPRKFRERDVLVITVSDSVWMQQLSLQKLTILDSLNKLLPPEGMIRDIWFETGNIHEVRRSHTPLSLKKEKIAGPNHKTGRILSVPEKTRQRIIEHAEALTEPVRDSELKDMLQRVYLKSRLKNKAGRHTHIEGHEGP